MIVGIVFAVMAVLGLGALVYRLVVTRGEILTALQKGGGSRLEAVNTR
jgi:hypothetical protein